MHKGNEPDHYASLSIISKKDMQLYKAIIEI